VDAAPVQADSVVRRAAWIVVSLLSLGAVAWWASHQQEPRMPTGADGAFWLLAAVAVYGTALALRGWRWHRIMVFSGIPHRRADAYGLTLVAYMGNTVLPLRGGEVLRIGIMNKRSSARLSEIVGSVIAERVFDLAALGAMFAVLTWEGVAGSPTGTLAADIAAGLIVAAGAGLALYLALRRSGHFEAFAATVRPFAHASKLLARPEGIRLLAISLLIWFGEGVTLLLVGHALTLHLTLSEALLTAVIAALAASLPAGPGYAGSYDAGVLLALHASGIAGGSAVGFLLLARFVVFVPVTVVGASLFLLHYGGLRPKRSLNQAARGDDYERIRLDPVPSGAGIATTDTSGREGDG
jgi:glycosyltransferase 2 family protein